MSYTRLHTRTKTFWYRRAVPPRLRGHMRAVEGFPDNPMRSEFTVNLGTADPREANRRAARIDERVQTALAEAEAKLAKPVIHDAGIVVETPEPPQPILPRTAFAALERWEGAAIERAETEVFNAAGALNRFSDDAVRRGDLIYQLEQRAGPDWWTKIDGFDTALVDALRSEGIGATASHPTLPRLRTAFAVHWSRVLRAREQMEGGRWEWGGNDDDDARAQQKQVEPGPPLPAGVRKPKTLEAVLASYLSDAAPRIDPATLAETERVFRLFIEYVGPGKLAHTVDAETIREFRDEMLNLPARLTNAERAMSLASLIKQSKAKPPKERRTRKTVGKYLDFLSAVFGDALAFDTVATNPVSKAKFKPDRKPQPRSRLPFDQSDLETIFSSPLFVGCAGITRHHLPGEFVYWGARYWLMLLGVTTGARLNELGQLRVADVKPGAAVPHICITMESDDDDGETQVGKSIKNDSSLRDIPIHPSLLRLGFLDYHAAMERRGEVYLFPELDHGGKAEVTKNISQWFGRYFGHLGIVDKRKVFHSFRHTVVSQLGNVAPDYLRRQITGHSSGHVGDRYGRGILTAELDALKRLPLDFLDRLKRPAAPTFEVDVLCARGPRQRRTRGQRVGAA